MLADGVVISTMRANFASLEELFKQTSSLPGAGIALSLAGAGCWCRLDDIVAYLDRPKTTRRLIDAWRYGDK